jgi:mannose-6-phosphate isomerase-like protein (cupin superfamily)
MSSDNANEEGPTGLRAAQVVLPCDQLEPTLRWFVDRLGFRVERIAPADDPRSALLSGHGLQIALQRGSGAAPGTLRVLCDDPAALAGGQTELLAPNGTRIELVDASPALRIPELHQELVVNPGRDAARWVTGRAGMRYRDLIPGRQGGRFIASHIRIEAGGAVPDSVHYHAIRFQLIYCVSGWVRLVYEDQGPAFVLQAGDCVLQPPLIRHRVLECSAGLEVIEIACPAEHDTLFDHELALPTATLRPERDFGGQLFVRHQAAEATWQPWRVAGFQCRDTGIADATSGLAGASVVRCSEPAAPTPWCHDGEFLLLDVLAGVTTLEIESHGPVPMEPGSCAVVPAGLACTLVDCSPGLEFLEVCLPGHAAPNADLEPGS